jgi:hypothetical protein
VWCGDGRFDRVPSQGDTEVNLIKKAVVAVIAAAAIITGTMAVTTPAQASESYGRHCATYSDFQQIHAAHRRADHTGYRPWVVARILHNRGRFAHWSSDADAFWKRYPRCGYAKDERYGITVLYWDGPPGNGWYAFSKHWRS